MESNFSIPYTILELFPTTQNYPKKVINDNYERGRYNEDEKKKKGTFDGSVVSKLQNGLIERDQIQLQ